MGKDERIADRFWQDGREEKLKGLLRASVPVDAVPEERWVELLRAFVATPVLKQAWEQAGMKVDIVEETQP